MAGSTKSRCKVSVLPGVLASLLLCSAAAWGLVPGGGKESRDCWLEFEAAGLALNHPIPPKKAREIRCFDGEAGCDLDGAVNGTCTFDADVCLYNEDPTLPKCTPADVTTATVRNKKGASDLASLQSAIDALLPATSHTCTTGQTWSVPLGGTSARRKTAQIHVKTVTTAGKTADRLRASCLRRDWPSHGYDHRNVRASATESTLTPSNAADLTLLWELDLEALGSSGPNGVTSTPTVMGGRVYVTSWNGSLYAVDAKSGEVDWSYDTGAHTGAVPGVQSSATLTADGRVLVGDSHAVVHCLDAKSGELLWQTPLADSASDHIWGSPTVANGRVYVGIASHLDTPCVRGRVAALDLDDGDEQWTTYMVPERVCDDDTAVECTSNAECGAGTCVDARGAGVTATVAVEATGESLYVNTVGCFTFPSIGHSDSILKLDAATGNIVWAARLSPPEQFGACSTDPSIDCGTSAVCPAGGACNRKAFFHDFGFLNGPLLVEAGDGLGGTRTLLVSGSKDGSLYALDPSTGGPVWQNAVLPAPVTPAFAGFGLFNGAVGFADDRFHATLYEFIPAIVPAPEHLMAFSAVDGATLWDEEIGVSWGSIALAGGLVFAGTQAETTFFVHDAASGNFLNGLPLPATSTSGASIVDGVVYVGYGILGDVGGVRAYALP